MHSIRIHKFVGLIIFIFYRIGIWHQGDLPTVKDKRVKLFYSIYYSLFFLSLIGGAIKNGNRDDSIFLAELSIGIAVLAIKLWLLIWKQNEILNLLNRVCVLTIRNVNDHYHFNDKHSGFMKFVTYFVISEIVAGSVSTAVLPILGSEKKLFVDIAFPLDYRSSEIAFWMATIFLFTEMVLSTVIMMFTIIIWYLLLTCSLRYEVLGNELTNMGRSSAEENGNRTERQKQKIFLQDLKTSINAHLHLRDLVIEVDNFLTNLFFIQFGTSGLCICGSIYCLAFDIGETLLERFVYLFVFFDFISELFMITYFGNEIMLKSDRLSYSLFESDWYNQPQSTKKCIILFGEYLKRPQELVIGKLYPLTLETFTRILNSAYSMFNILKRFQ